MVESPFTIDQLQAAGVNPRAAMLAARPTGTLGIADRW
jgi:hypothetical protein